MKKFPQRAQMWKRNKRDWLFVVQTSFPSPVGKGINPLMAILDCARKCGNVDWKEWLLELDEEARTVVGGVALVSALETARAGDDVNTAVALKEQAARVAELTAKAASMVDDAATQPLPGHLASSDEECPTYRGSDEGRAEVQRQIDEARTRQAEAKAARDATAKSEAAPFKVVEDADDPGKTTAQAKVEAPPLELDPPPQDSAAVYSQIVDDCKSRLALSNGMGVCSSEGKVCSDRTCPRT